MRLISRAMTTPHELLTRPGLPDHLRVLAERYDRADWEEHPNFSGLTRFWLDRHGMFRQASARIEGTVQAALERKVDPRQAAGEIARLAQFTLQQLHGHHTIEDHQYFPIFAGFDKRLSEAFDLLDHDHHALDDVMGNFADTANAALRAMTGQTTDSHALPRFHEVTREFGRVLERHLWDEEEIVVPLILEYAPQEFA